MDCPMRLAWFEAFATALKELGFVQMTLDVAFFVHWRDDGCIAALLIVHVDDC